MNYQHQKLAAGKWRKMSFFEQMANIGSEVFRTIKWKGKDKENSRLAFERALELFDLTLTDPKNKKGLKEIARAREIFVDFILKNTYHSTEKSWHNYFYAFNYAARLRA